MKRIITVIAVLAAALSTAIAGNTKPVAEHVVLITLDGWAAKGMDVADMPNVKALMAEGSWTLHKRSVWPTASNKNWPTMFSGMGPELTGFYDPVKEGNYGSPKNIKAFESTVPFTSIFSVCREKYPEAEIGALYQWDWLHCCVSSEALDRESQYDDDALMCADAEKYIIEKKPDLLMLGFDHPDHEGHTLGWYTPAYFEALHLMDSYIGRIVAALKKAGIWKNSIIILSSDHGGTGRAHGGSTIFEYETPFVVCGKGIRKGYEIQGPMMQYDVAATVAAVMGAKTPQTWVGKPVREIFKNKAVRSPKTVPAVRRAGHIVVIGMDGWASEGMDKADMPVLKQFIAEGSSTMRKTSVVPTLSTENWATMFNGMPPEMHGFYSEIGDNWRAPLVVPAVRDRRGLTPTVFSLAREQFPDIEMGAIHQWSGISNLIDKDAFSHYAHLSFQGVCDDAVEYIRTKKPDLALIIWDEPDGTAHDRTWFSKPYFDKLHELDGLIGKVKQALADAGILDDTIIIFTSDHGGTVDEAHGGTRASERFTPFVVWGKGVRKGYTIQGSVVQYDVAATIASALGVTPAPYWYGRPVNEVFE